MTTPQFDERDATILAQRTESWDKRPGPRVGDFVQFPDGYVGRFTHDWGDAIQTTCRQFPGDVSFYFGDGYCSYSGALDPAVSKTRLEHTGCTARGVVWFFHHDLSRAHNGVKAEIPCRVYKLIA
jgi:hypothetical protein